MGKCSTIDLVSHLYLSIGWYAYLVVTGMRANPQRLMKRAVNERIANTRTIDLSTFRFFSFILCLTNVANQLRSFLRQLNLLCYVSFFPLSSSSISEYVENFLSGSKNSDEKIPKMNLFQGNLEVVFYLDYLIVQPHLLVVFVYPV